MSLAVPSIRDGACHLVTPCQIVAYGAAQNTVHLALSLFCCREEWMLQAGAHSLCIVSLCAASGSICACLT